MTHRPLAAPGQKNNMLCAHAAGGGAWRDAWRDAPRIRDSRLGIATAATAAARVRGGACASGDGLAAGGERGERAESSGGQAAWTSFQRVRTAAPLVQCLTNDVSMDLMANALLCVGASPAMVHSVDEAAEFAARSSVLCVNVGTLTSDRLAGMRLAVAEANRLSKPWVLDPVGMGATRYRSAVRPSRPLPFSQPPRRLCQTLRPRTHGRSHICWQACMDLLRMRPTVLRGNGSEVSGICPPFRRPPPTALGLRAASRVPKRVVRT